MGPPSSSSHLVRGVVGRRSAGRGNAAGHDVLMLVLYRGHQVGQPIGARDTTGIQEDDDVAIAVSDAEVSLFCDRSLLRDGRGKRNPFDGGKRFPYVIQTSGRSVYDHDLERNRARKTDQGGEGIGDATVVPVDDHDRGATDVFVLDHGQSNVFWHEQGRRGPRDAEGPWAVRDRVYSLSLSCPHHRPSHPVTELPAWDADTG